MKRKTFDIFVSYSHADKELIVVLTQKSVEGKLEGVNLTQEGKDHAKGTANLYERI
jgi:hypothetical protein